uniref:Uncharacterized protein n=1 Tax=Parastrongyloides trichosuri TaxID=131310 RepID=A0A0N4ZB34_PARTI
MMILKYFLSKLFYNVIIFIFFCIFLTVSSTSTSGKGKACRHDNIYQYAKNYSTPDLIFFGLTSDCQIFFSTLLNIDKINDLKVDHKHQHCSPHYTKLHVVNYLGQLSILVTTLRHGNNFCTMNIEFPAVEFYTSSSLFTYSLMSSLPFFACSSLPINSGFLLQPSQAYMDPRISDVIHFIGKNTSSKEIIELQFKISPEGYLIKHKQTYATDIFGKRQQRVLVTVDRRSGLLYGLGDTEALSLQGTCSFDPASLPEEKHHAETTIYSLADKYSKVDSLAVDEKTVMLGIQKSRDVQKTRLLIGHLKERITFKCFISLPYLAQVSMISKRTVDKLNEGHLMTLEMELREKQRELELRMSGKDKYRNYNNTFKIAPSILPEKDATRGSDGVKGIEIKNNKQIVSSSTTITPLITTKEISTTTIKQKDVIKDSEEENTLNMEKELAGKIESIEKENDELRDIFITNEIIEQNIPEFEPTNDTFLEDGDIAYLENSNEFEDKSTHTLPTDATSSEMLSTSADDSMENMKQMNIPDNFVNTSKGNASHLSNKSLTLLTYNVKNHFPSFFTTIFLIFLTVYPHTIGFLF